MLKKANLAKAFACLASCIFLLLLPGCAAEEYEVKVEIQPESAGEVTGSGTYREGEKVTVKTEANEGYTFTGWIENGVLIEANLTYEFQLEKERELLARFEKEPTMEIETETIGDYKVNKIVVDELYLQKEGEILELSEDRKHYHLFIIGEDYYMTAYPGNNDESHGVKTLKFWSADDLDLIDTLTIETTGQPALKTLKDNLFVYEDSSKTHLVQISQDGVKDIATFDLKDYSWDLDKAAGYNFHEEFFPGDDWREVWKSFEPVAPMAGPGLISIQIAEVGDYIFAYPDYSRIFNAFKLPPTLEEPFFKIFQFADGELELVDGKIFLEPIYSTDVAYYPDNQALVACGEKGFILLNLDGFSYKILQAGGNYLADEHRLKQVESGLPRMNVHHFYNVTQGGIILAKTWLPAPVCSYSDLIHLWAPVNGELKLLAESSVGMGTDRLWLFEKNWWLKGQQFLTLNDEQVSTAVKNEPDQDLPEIIAYYDTIQERAEVSNIIDQVLDRKNDKWSNFQWRYFNGEVPMKIQKGATGNASPGIVKIGSDHIDILLVLEETLSIPDTKNPGSLSWPVSDHNTTIDIKRERVFFASEEKIYILSFDALFDPGS